MQENLLAAAASAFDDCGNLLFRKVNVSFIMYFVNEL